MEVRLFCVEVHYVGKQNGVIVAGWESIVLGMKAKHTRSLLKTGGIDNPGFFQDQMLASRECVRLELF